MNMNPIYARNFPEPAATRVNFSDPRVIRAAIGFCGSVVLGALSTSSVAGAAAGAAVWAVANLAELIARRVFFNRAHGGTTRALCAGVLGAVFIAGAAIISAVGLVRLGLPFDPELLIIILAFQLRTFSVY